MREHYPLRQIEWRDGYLLPIRHGACKRRLRTSVVAVVIRALDGGNRLARHFDRIRRDVLPHEIELLPCERSHVIALAVEVVGG